MISGLAERGVEPIFVEKAGPQQNSFIERFNGTMRDEVLHGEEFDSILDARVVITAWLDIYNRQRTHRGLAMMAPLAIAAANNVVAKGASSTTSRLDQSVPCACRLSVGPLALRLDRGYSMEGGPNPGGWSPVRTSSSSRDS